MAKRTIEDIFDKLPKKTPTWALGLVTIIISSATALTAMYVVSHTEIAKLVESSIVEQEVSGQFDRNERDKVVTSVLNLVHTNSEQITGLTSALADTQKQNAVLSVRVDRLEEDLNSTQRVLSDCQHKLEKCALK